MLISLGPSLVLYTTTSAADAGTSCGYRAALVVAGWRIVVLLGSTSCFFDPWLF